MHELTKEVLAKVKFADDETIERCRSMTGRERVREAMELTRQHRERVLEGVRRDHPDWPNSRLRRELMRRLWGQDYLPPDWPISEAEIVP